jgi:hypothetical protein
MDQLDHLCIMQASLEKPLILFKTKQRNTCVISLMKGGTDLALESSCVATEHNLQRANTYFITDLSLILCDIVIWPR